MSGGSLRVVMQSDISAVSEHFLVHSVICAIYWKVCHSGEVMQILSMPTVDQMIRVGLIYFLRILCENCCMKFDVLGMVMYWC